MEARRSAQCFAPEGGRDSTDTTDTASIMGADGGQSPGQNSTTARTATQRQPNAATPEIVALRGRAARSQRGNPGTGLTRVNARMELQGGRRMSLTKCSRGDVVEPNQSRPGTPKTPAKSQNLYASIGNSKHRRPECIPACHTLKPGKSACVDSDRVDCWAWKHAEVGSEASIRNGCEPWAA